jgi:prolyl oligopeptidase
MMRFALPAGLLSALLLSACASSSTDMKTPAMNEPTKPALASTDDPYLWLEEVMGDKALSWVREQNAASEKVLKTRADFAPTKTKLLEILNSKEKIPYVTRIGNHFYNLWQDEKNQRGLWRRTTLSEYAKATPAWETVIDLDALGKTENENWVWGGASCLPAKTDDGYERCLIEVSRGGADAKVIREFDLKTKQFVTAAQNAFTLPEAKSAVDWIDRDTVYVATDFGAGSMTYSGYARIIKEWKRGTPLTAAKTIYEADKKDVYAYAAVDHTPGFERRWFAKATDFYNTEQSVLQGDKLVKIDKPSDAIFMTHHEWAFLQLRSAYTVGGKVYAPGSLLAIKYDTFMKGERNFEALFEPTATRSLARGGVSFTRKHVLLSILDNVAGKIEELSYVSNASGANGGWKKREMKTPFPGTLSISPLYDPTLNNDPFAEHYLLNYADFLTPDSLYLGRAGNDERDLIKRRPSFYNAQGMKVDQFFVKSKDGTRVPYFVVWPKTPSAAGTNPTLLYGYGGFQVSEQPWYSGAYGSSWLDKGGVFVLANIRGGGEFGPSWHKSAIKANKQRSYDDFAAIAEDLIARKITNAKQLGIMGGSNGGLLMGAMFTQRPELFNAVVCQVPLLDMKRYHKLLAGASWMAEYGDPEKADEWAYISQYSPYQNVKAGVKYPRVLFTTSTRDDRVHPAHARKMVARMKEQGHEVLYYENIEGGHGGAADNEQRANLLALEFSYLWMQLTEKNRADIIR